MIIHKLIQTCLEKGIICCVFEVVKKWMFYITAYQVNVTADYNMDLVIALEMSRLQMIEDEMKQRQRQESNK